MNQGLDDIELRGPATDAAETTTSRVGHTTGAVFTWLQFLCLVLSVMLFYGFKLLTGQLSALAGLGLALLLGLAFRHVRYTHTSAALGIVLKALAGATTAYLVLTYPYYVPGGEPGGMNEGQQLLLNLAWLPSVAFGVLALARPMFALLPMTYLVVLKGVLSATSGLPLSQTDYAIIPESALLALFAVGLAWLARQRGVFQDRSLHIFGDQVFYLVVAVHFANYFYAGYQKLALDGPVLAWLSNETQNIFYSSLLYKTNPLGAWDSGVKAFGSLLEHSVLLTNGLVLVFQLASLAALARRGLIVLFAVFYDLMHLAIFVASGIFFWKWIILNLAIIVAARRWSFQVPPRPLFAFGVVALLVAPVVFYIPWLGWYDSREVNSTTIRAVLDDGSRLELPSNFFRNYSVIFAQNRIARTAAERLPTGAFGATWNHQDYLRSYDCKNELLPPASTEQRSIVLENLSSFIAGYHAFVLRQSDKNGRFAYDYFPHHIWSNPLQFGAVADLDLRRVAGYELVIDAVCIAGISKGSQLELVGRTRTVFPIPLGS